MTPEDLANQTPWPLWQWQWVRDCTTDDEWDRITPELAARLGGPFVVVRVFRAARLLRVLTDLQEAVHTDARRAAIHRAYRRPADRPPQEVPSMSAEPVPRSRTIPGTAGSA
jgi:hypothetical protein